MPKSTRMAQAAAAPLRAVRLGALDAVLDRRANGELLIRTSQPIGHYHANLSEPLEHWAKAAPERVFLAQRDAQDQWRTLTYAQVLDRVTRIGAALLRSSSTVTGASPCGRNASPYRLLRNTGLIVS